MSDPLIQQTVSAESIVRETAARFPLPWSAYVRLLSVMAKYALEGLPNKVLAAEYRMALPDEKTIAAELERTQKTLVSKTKLPSS